MRGLITVLLLAISLVFAGCMRVMMVAYGIKQNPKPKTEQQIKKGMRKYGFDARPNYAITEAGYNYYLPAKLKILNQVLVLDDAGRNITLKKQITCSSNYLDLIAHYNDTSVCRVNTLITLDSVKHYMRNLDGSAVNLSPAPERYKVFVTWTSFAGRLNKESSRAFYSALLKQKDPNIDIYFWDLDKRDFWEK